MPKGLCLPIEAQRLYNRIDFELPMQTRQWISKEATKLRRHHFGNFERTIDEDIDIRFPQFYRRESSDVKRLHELLRFAVVCKAYWSDQLKELESLPQSAGDDAQLANVDMQEVLQKQQQTLQMVSTIGKTVFDTEMAIIRKIGG